MTITLLTHRFVRLAIVAVSVAVGCVDGSQRTTRATYEVVASFDGIFVGGRQPRGPLIEGRDGNLYGTTESSRPFRMRAQFSESTQPEC